MPRFRSLVALSAAAVVLFVPAAGAQRAPATFVRHQPTAAQFLKPGLPMELVSARKVDRIAWMAYEEGRRNVFTAAAPLYRPVRVTSFLKDDGVDLTGVKISDDGSTIVFVRGHALNNQGWVANPAGDPAGGDRAIWAARVATPGVSWRLAEGSAPEVSPDGRFVLYMKDGQIYRARVGPGPATTAIDRGEKPFITAWGRNSGPRWSPDGTRIAFSSDRGDHSFIAVYSTITRLVTYVAPSVDRDTSPTWSPDGKRIAFLRRPGLPFGLQSTPGRASGLPDPPAGRGNAGGAAVAAPGGGRAGAPAGRQGGAAANPNAPVAAPAQTGAGRGGRGAATEPQIPADAPLAQQPGLYRATLPGGNTLAIMIADVTTDAANDDDATQVWQPAPGDAAITNINAIQWIGDKFVFTQPAQDDEEGNRHYAMDVSGASAPVRLNTTKGIVEDATAAAYSKDGKTFYYRGHRSPPHLGRADIRRDAGASHDGRRYRERAGAARVRQTPRGPQCRCEASAGRGALADLWGLAGLGAKGDLSEAHCRLSDVVDGRADQRHAQGPRRPGVQQPAVSAAGHQAR
jgi:dipeptidyl-peptidase 4